MDEASRLAATVSANILRRRKALGLNQAQFAAKLRKTAPFVHMIESGKSCPTIRTISAIARVLRCEPWELLVDDKLGEKAVDEFFRLSKKAQNEKRKRTGTGGRRDRNDAVDQGPEKFQSRSSRKPR